MRLLPVTDYALRVLVRLAAEPDRRFKRHELAAELDMSKNRLQRVVQKLRSHGFIVESPGISGGIRLANPPGEIRVGAVVRSFETERPIVDCLGGGKETGSCSLIPECRLKGMMSRSREVFFQTLDWYTLSDCLGQGRYAMGEAPAL